MEEHYIGKIEQYIQPSDQPKNGVCRGLLPMKAQQVLYRVQEWFSSMNLKMNEDKTNFMFVRSRRSRITIPDQVV